MSANNKPRAWLSWRCKRDKWLAAAVTVLFCVSISISQLTEGDINSRIHVVGIETMAVARNMFCPQKCSGTLLTQIIVLTAASCTEFMGVISNITSETSNSSESSTTESFENVTLAPELNITGFIEGDIKVYATLSVHPVYDEMVYANVSEKYVHPEWNSKTYVANLVLLKLNKRFHLIGEMPDMMNNYMLNLPDKLYFKGLGMIDSSGPAINSKINITQEVPNDKSIRIVRIKFAANICPSENDGKWENDTNWWSFLCTEPEFTHKDYNGTLCSGDVGGPLYKHNSLSGMPQLYGVFSHMYHTVFPICASAQCFVQDNAPYPCSSSDNLYYKFTALIGRYTSWLNRTIERIHIAPTPTPVRKCPPVSITAMDPFDTTLDPIYDVDRYSDRARSMVANRKLCPKHDSTILSSGNPLHRNRSLRTVCVVISGVHVLQLWRWIAF